MTNCVLMGMLCPNLIGNQTVEACFLNNPPPSKKKLAQIDYCNQASQLQKLQDCVITKMLIHFQTFRGQCIPKNLCFSICTHLDYLF